ncbi:MAG TPA: 2OG-Fe(II) oxygenase [bacterium]|nr:2OG-Fe(II) oxygenase [bacterium]
MADRDQQVWSWDSFLSAEEAGDWLTRIEAYRSKHELTEIHRPMRGRSLRYFVIDGEAIDAAFPELAMLYRRIQAIAEESSGLRLEPMRQRKVAININITRPGGEYRWHYDRNALTAILYLNAVAGGVTEMHPGHRFLLRGRSHTAWQKALDRLWMSPVGRRFSSKLHVAPAPGRLLLMRGDRCLHSVSPVEGAEERVNFIFSYDQVGARHPQEEGLNDYLYSSKKLNGADPNYSHRIRT